MIIKAFPHSHKKQVFHTNHKYLKWGFKCNKIENEKNYE